MGIAGDREALPTGDHLPASSQGKTVNLLLVRGDRICGSSNMFLFPNGSTVV